METDINIIKSQFRNSASGIFSRISEDFTRTAKKLDRQGDENVFRQLQGRYVNELEKQLTQIAEKLIGQYNGDINLLKRELATEISYDVSEFRLKMRSM
jgi:hypothetical protein